MTVARRCDWCGAAFRVQNRRSQRRTRCDACLYAHRYRLGSRPGNPEALRGYLCRRLPTAPGVWGFFGGCLSACDPLDDFRVTVRECRRTQIRYEVTHA